MDLFRKSALVRTNVFACVEFVAFVRLPADRGVADVIQERRSARLGGAGAARVVTVSCHVAAQAVHGLGPVNAALHQPVLAVLRGFSEAKSAVATAIPRPRTVVVHLVSFA